MGGDLPLPLRYAQLRKLRGDVRAGRCGLDRFVDVQDLAVGTDVERPAAGKSFCTQDAIRSGDLFARIRQNRVVGFNVRSKLLVLFGRVDARREIGNIELPDRFAALTERLAFGRSATGEGFGEPGEHDGAFALVVGK